MISIDALLADCSRLERPVLERWIAEDWVRPDRREGELAFRDIDVSRVRLILELRDQFDVNESALPVVLLLLDQLYDLRRQMRVLGDAFVRIAPGDIRSRLASELSTRAS